MSVLTRRALLGGLLASSSMAMGQAFRPGRPPGRGFGLSTGVKVVAGTATSLVATFPALGAAYDPDWANDVYATVAPNIGTQSSTSNATPILYHQEITQVSHYVENADGTLALRPATAPRRSTKGLHSFNGLDQQITAPRDLSNAAWTKTNATAVRNAMGRDDVANSATTITFTADGGTISQAITVASDARRLRLDAKRVSGTAPLDVSIDGGATFTSLTPTGSGYLGWDNLAVPIQTLANNTVILRSLSGNSFVVDFVSLWGGREGIASSFPLSGRLTSKTLIGRDRLHHNIGATGGTSGTEGINLIRSRPIHGMYVEFNYSVACNIITPLGGYQVYAGLDGSITVLRQTSGATAVVTGARIGDGTATTGLNKFMYFTSNGVLRIALNGVLSTFALAAPDTTTTHDIFTNGGGTAMEGFVRRGPTWFEIREPTDAEMIATTML